MTSTVDIRTASGHDTLRVVQSLLLPLLAQGPVRRRPWAVRLAARRDLDRRADDLLHELTSRYGEGPLRLRIPGRTVVLVLSASDARHLLLDPGFTPANREKAAALRHFQPHGVLISRGERRRQRRQLNERVLDTGHPHHRLAHVFNAVIAEEFGPLAERSDPLGWPEFAAAHQRLTRRIVLGDGAAADETVLRQLNRLRSTANWAYLAPPHPLRQRRFAARVRRYLKDPDPFSLAGLLRGTPAPPGTDPVGQVPHWLFAFDAVGIATFRALALVVASGEGAAVARDPRYLRACVQESLRLWPTTPVLLRDSREAAYVVVSSFFHRDERSLSYADRFAPETWLDGRAEIEPGIMPFSAGPARCPGEDLVLLVATSILAELLRDRDWRLDSPQWNVGALPRTSDHTAIRLSLT